MSDGSRTSTVRRQAAYSAEIDQGLRSYMNRIYSYMSAALAVTGAVAYLFGNVDVLFKAIYTTPLVWVVMLAPLVVVLIFASSIGRMSVGTAQAVFWLFSALMGASTSYIFVMYTDASIVKTFLVTAIAFLGLSLYGYTTKRSLAFMGTFLLMGLIGLIAAMLVNIFVGSTMMELGISVIGVLIFAGLTAWDTQKLKNMYLGMANRAGAEVAVEKTAIMGALTLYLDFINMFLFLLRFLGNRE